MADIPNRSDLEAELARRFSKLSSAHRKELLSLLGNPPNYGNVPGSFWDRVMSELNGSFVPFLAEIYMDSAERLVAGLPIGVSWDLINTQAAIWARNYGGELVRDITNTTRRAVGEMVAAFFERGQTRGDLEAALTRLFGPARAETIAITEITRAATRGEQEIAIEIAKLGVEMIPVFQTSNDDLVCPICAPLNNKQMIGEYEGVYPPLHPRCLPGDTLVLPIGRIAAGSERWYEGDIVTIETLENQLTVTPNHPILTRSGWVAAGLLQEGDYVLGYSARQWEAEFVKIDNQNGISAIKNIFSSLDVDGFRVPVAAPDFHGDGAGSDVAVIRPNREVVDNIQTDLSKPMPKNPLIGRNIVLETSFTHLGSKTQLIEGDISTAGSIVSGFDLAQALLGGHIFPLDNCRLRLVTGADSGLQEALPEGPSVDTSLLGKLVLGFSGDISLQKIIKVRNMDFAGHVYNLQTESGLYVAAGIITHNCRCWLNHELPPVKR